MPKLLTIAVFALLASAATPNADKHYLEWKRPLKAAGTGEQYFVVDEELWKSSKAHLDDLRLYSDDHEVLMRNQR